MRAIRRLLRRRGRDEPPAPAAAAGTSVTVWIRGLGRTAGTVAAATDRSAVIVLAVDPRFGDETLDAAEAVVEHTGPRGVYRQPGSVRFAAGGSVSFTPSGEPAREQRRDFFRLTVDLTVSATLGSGETEVELHVVNLSANGLLVDRPLADAGTLWLSIPIADGMPPIAPRGAVVRDAEGGTQGVRFDYISDEDQDRLVRFVMREQVRLRREGRL